MVYILIDELGYEIDRSKDKDRIDKALSRNIGSKIVILKNKEV